MSARLKGFGIPAGEGGIRNCSLIIRAARLITGTLGASAQTAAANQPPETNEPCILLNAASRFGKSINPQRHNTAS